MTEDRISFTVEYPPFLSLSSHREGKVERTVFLMSHCHESAVTGLSLEPPHPRQAHQTKTKKEH